MACPESHVWGGGGRLKGIKGLCKGGIIIQVNEIIILTQLFYS